MTGPMLFLLPHAVERAAARTPDRDAVRCAGQALTYEELAERSDRLAGALIGQGVRRGERVGIHAGKGLAATVAMYGIMKAGAAYVPLDPASPPARQALVIRDCGIRHLVTEPGRQGALNRLLEENVPIECVVGAGGEMPERVRSCSWSDVASHPPAPPVPNLVEMDLAYVLYTSGSTGTPKGVMHSHRSALAFAEVAAATYELTGEDRLSNHAPLHFDLSTLDYFSSAVAGATTVVIPDAYTKMPASFAGLIEAERLTVLYAVPLALTYLVLHGALEKRDLSSVRWVLFGGEPFPPKHLRSLMAALPGARFSNVYGPTEVNGVTYWVLPEQLPETDDPIPIGRPYANVETMILGDDGQAVANGEQGELLVRTPSMMRGYWGRRDLSERAFHVRSVFEGCDDVYLRTGDLVRLRDDGLLEFLGRMDRQVKIKGYRIELDEVEVALLSHEAVETAAVFAIRGPDGSSSVEAAVTLRTQGALDADSLRAHLAEILPRYAVPDRVLILDAMPRTSTGKIDRQALGSQTGDSAGIPAAR
jgi:amino acid adenylation domain-containing protein